MNNNSTSPNKAAELLRLKIATIENLLSNVRQHLERARNPGESNSKIESVTIMLVSRCGHDQRHSMMKITRDADFNTLPIFETFLETYRTRLEAEALVTKQELKEFNEGVK